MRKTFSAAHAIANARAYSRHLEKFSHTCAGWIGTSGAFLIAIILIVLWLISGVFFAYSNSWQTSFTSFTSVITFLMLFLMQRSDNKKYLAIQVKLNELIASKRGASNSLINIEEASEQDIKNIYNTHRELIQRSME